MVCELGLDNNLYLIHGFNRRQCYEELNQSKVIVDVVQFDLDSESMIRECECWGPCTWNGFKG